MTTKYSNSKVVEQQKSNGENTEWFTLLAAANDRATSYASDEQTNRSAEGVLIEVILSDKKNSGSFTPTIFTKDDAGNTITLVAFTALTANGTKVYLVHPHADKTATVLNSLTEEGTISLPRLWWISMVANGNGTTDSFDMEVHGCYVR